MIPLIAHFIWLGSSQHTRWEEYSKNVDDFKRLNPSWQVIFWREDRLRSELDFEYVDYLSTTYHKVDYLRLSILHRFGGMYLDTDMVSLRPFPPNVLNEEKVNMACVTGDLSTCNNCLMASRPGHPFLEVLIREGKRRYRMYPLARTMMGTASCFGPQMFFEHLTRHGMKDCHPLGSEIIQDINFPITRGDSVFLHRSHLPWYWAKDFDTL